MQTLFLITGAAGHLGGTICRELLARKKEIREKNLMKNAQDSRQNFEKNKNSRNEKPITSRKKSETNEIFDEDFEIRGFDVPNSKMIDGIEKFYGDILDPADLAKFMQKPRENTRLILIHCAGIVSIASKYDPRVYEVNVLGTRNILHAAIDARVAKFIQISSVHAIPEKPKGEIIEEIKNFDAKKVRGFYAKTKAEAAEYVMKTAKNAKLNFNIIHPSGIVGPYDGGKNHTSALLIDFYNHKLTSAVKGGYDFVDVRDVARGVISCAKNGKSGECYILSNKYFTVREFLDLEAEIIGRKKLKSYIALWFAKLTAPLAEMYYKIRKVPPLYTKYSLYTIETNAHFSHKKADRELNYKTRNLAETIKDSLDWFKKINLIK